MWKVWNKGILCLKQNWFNEITIVTSIYIPFYMYHNFRSFTRTANYPHRPIIAYGNKKSQQITRTGIELFGGENVTLRWYIPVLKVV